MYELGLGLCDEFYTHIKCNQNLPVGDLVDIVDRRASLVDSCWADIDL